MIFEQAERLISIVRSDDVTAFGQMASPELYASLFGRFPLLSLLYLYSARRIVRRYRSDILRERPRVHYDAIAKADALFVSKAGKALRHYFDKEVSPLEMLAILGRGRELRKLYAVYPAADRYLNALHLIYYTRLGEGVVRKGDSIILPKEPLGFLQRKLLRIASVVMVCLFVLTLAITLAVPLYFGFGTEKTPYLIRGEKALAKHYAEKEKVLSIQEDLTLSGTGGEVSAEILGNDRLIHLTAPFADTFTGILRNVTFVLEEGYPATSIIKVNRGKLENVSVVTASTAYDKASFTETLTAEEEDNVTNVFSLFTTVNEGIIESCTAVITLNFVGEEGSNCYFASFAAENHGTIRACRAQGYAASAVVDMAGIVAVNHSDGAVLECGAAVDLTQRTTIEKWNPNVAGIACENEGTISACVNSGALSAYIELPSHEEESVILTGAYAAGIADVNVGSIQNCTNDGEIYASGGFGYAFAAGITARNTYSSDGEKVGSVSGSSGRAKVSAVSTSNCAFAGGIAARNEQNCTIEKCRQSADVRATAPETSEGYDTLFAAEGGICGYDVGLISASIFTGTVSVGGDNHYVGAICGLTHLYYSFYGYGTLLSGNAYVTGAGESYAIGTLIFNNASFLRPKDLAEQGALSFLDAGTTRFSTLEELKASEVYDE